MNTALLLNNPIKNIVIPSGLVPKGAYDNATDYAVGDSVDYLGSSYVMFVDAAAGNLPTDTTYWQVLAHAGVATVTDTNSIDLTLTSPQDLKADLVIQDTTSVDLAVDASGLKATVLPAGVDHNSLANLTTGDPHTQYLKLDQTAGQTIGATGARLTKLWATDITVTNAITGSITGLAGTATKLATARAINGVDFDGTAPITVTADANTLTGTTLKSTVVTSSLTAIGTLATGAVPASLVTAGTFGTGAYVMDTLLTVPLINGSSADNGDITINGTSSATKTTSYVILQATGGNVGIGTTSPGSLLSLKSVAANESATLGSELLSASGWTSTNWTGDWATGWTHTTGFTDALSNTLAAVVNNYYQIAYTVTDRTAGSFTVAFGGQSEAGITATGTFGPRATTTDNLIITPTSDFNGTIVISIKQITGNSIPTFALYDNTGVSNLEIRSSTNTLYNTFIGKNAGAKNTTGSYNSVQGVNALFSNTTGNSNSAQGAYALFSNTTGYYNSAQGYAALYANTTGYNNSAQGYAALYANTTGYNNSAQGTYALYANTTGSQNSAQGMQALFSNTTGSQNTAQGMYALFYNTTGSQNLAQGMQALFSNTTGSQNTAQGMYALFYNTTGSQNSAQGYAALHYNTTGSNNSAQGYAALHNLKPTSKAITAFADYSGTVAGTVKATSVAHGLTGTSTKMISGTTDYNGSKSITVIDVDSFYFTATWTTTQTGWWAINSEGRYNVAVGANAGRTLITGDSNTFLGYGAGYNVSQLTTAQNSMALGNGAYTTASNQIVLGNTAITQTLLNGNVGIGTTGPNAKLEVMGTIQATSYQADGISYYTSYLKSNFSEINAFELGISGHKLITTKDDYYNGSNLQFWTSDTPKVTIDTSGNVGIGTTGPTNLLSLGGQSDRIFWMERMTTAATAGKALSILAGGCVVGGTNLASGILKIGGQLATGSGNSEVQIIGTNGTNNGATADTTPAVMIDVINNKIGVFSTTPVVRQAHIVDASGGATVDAEARTAINAALLVLETYGWLNTA